MVKYFVFFFVFETDNIFNAIQPDEYWQQILPADL